MTMSVPLNQRLIRAAVRTRFRLTSRARALRDIRAFTEKYLILSGNIGPEGGRRTIMVPPMLGVDEDMRGWSVFMILEHNVIVNHTIHGIVRHLVLGEAFQSIDPKKDVMPSADPGPEQIKAFEESVKSYLDSIATLPRLRGTPTRLHPVFGQLDAHGWHCMFALHLQIHLKQVDAVARSTKAR